MLARKVSYVARASPRFSRAQAAYRVGKFMYKHRHKLKRAASTAFRAGRAAKRRRIMGAKGSNQSYRRWTFGSANAFASLKRKSLASSTLRFAEPPNTNDQIRAAPGMRFKCAGFKLCATFRNTYSAPIHVHMAIVQPKQDNIFITNISKDMFSDAVGSSRYKDFVDVTTDPIWDRNQDCSNLNPRKYNIMTHQRFQLNRQGDGGFADIRQKGSNYIHFEKYFKLNKTFEYENSASSNTIKPLWILIWYETLFPESQEITALDYNLNVISSVAPIRT